MKSKRLTKQEKNNRYKKRVAIFIAGLMAFSIIGFIGLGSVGSDSSASESYSIEYNGFTFVQENNIWRSSIDSRQYYFQSPPTALETILVPEQSSLLLASKKVYVAKDPAHQIDMTGFTLFYRNLFLNKGISAFEACTQEEGCGDFPVASCEEEVGVEGVFETMTIVLDISDESSITQEGSCVVISAPNELTRARLAERLAYDLLGVIENGS